MHGSLSPPLLKVPGTSSLEPITCFIRAPIFGCLSLSDVSVKSGKSALTLHRNDYGSFNSNMSCVCVSPPTGGVHVCGCETTQRVSATVLTIRRHGADYGLQILLLLQIGGVCLRRHCTQGKTHDQKCCVYLQVHFSFVTAIKAWH